MLVVLIARAKEDGQVGALIPDLVEGGVSILQYADDTVLFLLPPIPKKCRSSYFTKTTSCSFTFNPHSIYEPDTTQPSHPLPAQHTPTPPPCSIHRSAPLSPSLSFPRVAAEVPSLCRRPHLPCRRALLASRCALLSPRGATSLYLHRLAALPSSKDLIFCSSRQPINRSGVDEAGSAGCEAARAGSGGRGYEAARRRDGGVPQAWARSVATTTRSSRHSATGWVVEPDGTTYARSTCC